METLEGSRPPSKNGEDHAQSNQPSAKKLKSSGSDKLVRRTSDLEPTAARNDSAGSSALIGATPAPVSRNESNTSRHLSRNMSKISVVSSIGENELLDPGFHEKPVLNFLLPTDVDSDDGVGGDMPRMRKNRGVSLPAPAGTERRMSVADTLDSMKALQVIEGDVVERFKRFKERRQSEAPVLPPSVKEMKIGNKLVRRRSAPLAQPSSPMLEDTVHVGTDGVDLEDIKKRRKSFQEGPGGAFADIPKFWSEVRQLSSVTVASSRKPTPPEPMTPGRRGWNKVRRVASLMTKVGQLHQHVRNKRMTIHELWILTSQRDAEGRKLMELEFVSNLVYFLLKLLGAVGNTDDSNKFEETCTDLREFLRFQMSRPKPLLPDFLLADTIGILSEISYLTYGWQLPTQTHADADDLASKFNASIENLIGYIDLLCYNASRFTLFFKLSKQHKEMISNRQKVSNLIDLREKNPVQRGDLSLRSPMFFNTVMMRRKQHKHASTANSQSSDGADDSRPKTEEGDMSLLPEEYRILFKEDDGDSNLRMSTFDDQNKSDEDEDEDEFFSPNMEIQRWTTLGKGKWKKDKRGRFGMQFKWEDLKKSPMRLAADKIERKPVAQIRDISRNLEKHVVPMVVEARTLKETRIQGMRAIRTIEGHTYVDKCKDLMMHPRVAQVITRMWRAIEDGGAVTKEAYIDMNKSIFHFLGEGIIGDSITPEEIERSILWDFDVDKSPGKDGVEQVLFPSFYLSVFSLADNWTLSTDPGEMCELLEIIRGKALFNYEYRKDLSEHLARDLLFVSRYIYVFARQTYERNLKLYAVQQSVKKRNLNELSKAVLEAKDICFQKDLAEARHLILRLGKIDFELRLAMKDLHLPNIEKALKTAKAASFQSKDIASATKLAADLHRQKRLARENLRKALENNNPIQIESGISRAEKLGLDHEVSQAREILHKLSKHNVSLKGSLRKPGLRSIFNAVMAAQEDSAPDSLIYLMAKYTMSTVQDAEILLNDWTYHRDDVPDDLIDWFKRMGVVEARLQNDGDEEVHRADGDKILARFILEFSKQFDVEITTSHDLVLLKQTASSTFNCDIGRITYIASHKPVEEILLKNDHVLKKAIHNHYLKGDELFVVRCYKPHSKVQPGQNKLEIRGKNPYFRRKIKTIAVHEEKVYARRSTTAGVMEDNRQFENTVDRPETGNNGDAVDPSSRGSSADTHVKMLERAFSMVLGDIGEESEARKQAQEQQESTAQIGPQLPEKSRRREYPILST